MKNWSLKWQILLLVLSSVSAAVISLVFFTIGQIEAELEESLERKALSISSILAKNVEPGLLSQDRIYVAEVAQTAFADTDVHGVSVYDAADRQIYWQVEDSLLNYFEDTCNQVEEVEIHQQGRLLFVEVPIISEDQIIGCLWLVARLDQGLETVDHQLAGATA